MLNQLLRFGLFLSLGLWLKNRIKGLLILAFVLIIAWVLHNEFLNYSERSENDNYLALSYGIKWLVFVVCCVIYYFKIERKIFNSDKAERNEIEIPVTQSSQGDGFDFLRRKKVLESEADKLLKQTSKK